MPLSRCVYCSCALPVSLSSFFFNDTATTEIYTLSLHDALPISYYFSPQAAALTTTYNAYVAALPLAGKADGDRKSTRLNSSHTVISYAVFCLKKKKKTYRKITTQTTKITKSNKQERNMSKSTLS